MGDHRGGAPAVRCLSSSGLARGSSSCSRRVLSKATVHLYTDGLSTDHVRAVHLCPVEDPSTTVAELVARRGGAATVCVLPEGPLTVATVDER